MVTQLVFADGFGNPVSSRPTDGEGSGDGGIPQNEEQIFGAGSMLNASNWHTPHKSKRMAFSAAIDAMLCWFRQRVCKRDMSSSENEQKVLGVEYAADASSERKIVLAKKEVVVAAGAIHIPQLLMLSGIGSASALSKFGIQTRQDLPGVGANLQDHMQVACWYPYQNTTYRYPSQLDTDQQLVNQAWREYWTSKSGPFTSIAIGGVAFPSLIDTTSTYASIADLASSQPVGRSLAPSSDARVIAGFAKQSILLRKALIDRSRAAWEIINANDGGLAVANMRPFSRGTVMLRSVDPFVPPLIDPRYGSDPIDSVVLQAAIWFNARLLRTTAMASLDPEFVSPAENATIADIAQHIRTRAQTEYHVSGTAAMMPRELGGVVDSTLLVYGTSNLRVVDASIFPLVPAAHLQAVVYGVAEKVCRLLSEQNKSTDGAR